MNPDRAISVGEARERITAAVAEITETEVVDLADCIGRILLAPIRSQVDVPVCPMSAMDGYALAADPDRAVPFTLLIAGTALAGHPASVAVDLTNTVRIMTGAVMPTGSNAVVMQEQADATGGRVQFQQSVAAGHNVRLAGEDLAAGDVAVPSARRMNAADLQRAASLGHATLRVMRQLRVGLFSTGDEVQPVGAPLADGAVYDSNRQFLLAALNTLNVQVVDLGIVSDHPDSITAAFQQALRTVDLLITTGGAARGAADYTSQLLQQLGRTIFAGVAMKPGRPTRLTLLNRSRAAAGLGDELPVLTLPGTPFAMLTAFTVFATDLIDLMQGSQPRLRRFSARLDGGLMSHANRTEYLPARLRYDLHGAIATAPIRRSSTAGDRFDASIDALVELPAGLYEKRPGDPVAVILL